jgi:hypothetical protein
MTMSFTEARERAQIFSRFLGPRGRYFDTTTKGDLEMSGCNMALFNFMLEHGYFAPIAKDLYGLTWIGAMASGGLMAGMRAEGDRRAAAAVGEAFFDPLLNQTRPAPGSRDEARQRAATPYSSAAREYFRTARELAELRLAEARLALAELELRERRGDDPMTAGK